MVMRQTFLTVLTVLYGASGIVTFAGFFPTIRDLWKREPSANAITYWTWTMTTFQTALYAMFVLRDLVFSVVINLQLAACLIILILRLRLPK